MQINPKFKLGQVVYVKTDFEAMPRQVAGLVVRGISTITYEVTCGVEIVSAHSHFELSSDKPLFIGHQSN